MKLLTEGSNSYDDYDSPNYENSEFTIDDFDNMVWEIGAAVIKINPRFRRMKATVNGFGWRSMDGYKVFGLKEWDSDKKAAIGLEVLRAILPDTECHFKVSVDYRRRILQFNNAHHDKPMGGEIYEIKALNQAEQDKEDGNY